LGPSPAGAFPGGHGARFIYDYYAAHQILAVAMIDCLLGGGGVANFHESEAARLACESVPHDGYGVDRDSMSGEKILDIGLIRRVRQVPNKKLFHLETPRKTRSIMPRAFDGVKGGYCSK
jgi:hypothetical protein